MLGASVGGRGGEGCAKSAPESSGGVHGCSKLRARPGQRGDPAARPRRPVALRRADGGGGRVVGTDTTHLLCLAGSQSRPGRGEGAEATLWFLAPLLAPNPSGFQHAADSGANECLSAPAGLAGFGWAAAGPPRRPLCWFSF